MGEEELREFVQIATSMNHNTNTCVDVAIDTLVKQAANIHEILGHMALEFLVSQQRMQVITQNLANSLSLVSTNSSSPPIKD